MGWTWRTRGRSAQLLKAKRAVVVGGGLAGIAAAVVLAERGVRVTLVRLSDYAARNIPTTWFQRDYLPRFQGD